MPKKKPKKKAKPPETPNDVVEGLLSSLDEVISATDEIEALGARMKRLDEQEKGGIIDAESADIERNKIRLALIKLKNKA